MFCTNCGKELPDGSKFCPACGTAVEEKSAHIFEPEPAPDTAAETPTTESAGNNNPSLYGSTPFSAKEQEVVNTPLETVIGKNSSYYLREFKKIESGEKTKFNWAAFFFSAFFCLYRKCGELFKKYFLIPIALILVASIVTAIGTVNFSLVAMAVGGAASAVGSIWAFINCIRMGKNFNHLYYEHCKEVLTSGEKKKYGTSVVSPIILVVILVIAVSLTSIITTIGAFGSNTDAGKSDTMLNGEYGIVDPSFLGEYLYLNFNWNGDGTLQMYYSDDPSDVIEATYEISSADTEGMYSLHIFNEDKTEGEVLFEFYQLGENEFAVYFSDWITDGADTNTIMVPFTEEYGFTGYPQNTDNTGIPSASAAPEWCSGMYYGEDIYSTITFREDGSSQFDIFIYRLVDIEDCVITASTEDSIEFTGHFDIDVGSVSGVLESWSNGGEIMLTITASDWEMLPAGTSMTFYIDYKDPNYISGNSANDICGIYVLPDIPSNRLEIWENDGTIFLAMTNRNETLAVSQLSDWDMEWISDCLYFTTYTIGDEEEISGWYDPSVETLDFSGSLDDSILSAYSFCGTFFKQSNN